MTYLHLTGQENKDLYDDFTSTAFYLTPTILIMNLVMCLFKCFGRRNT